MSSLRRDTSEDLDSTALDDYKELHGFMPQDDVMDDDEVDAGE